MGDWVIATTATDWTQELRENLTIIIPAFRCTEFLPTAVASALHSPVKRILIADDGSGPDDLKVAADLADRHPDRIRLIASPVNRGTAANMNAAVEQIETPFFSKVDGDDVLIPGYLDAVFPEIATRPKLAILAGPDVRIAADEAIRFEPSLLPSVRQRRTLKIMSDSEAYRFILTWNPNPTSSGAIYRTAAFREVGGFDENIPWGEDWEIWLRFARTWEVGYVSAPSALYRIHNASTTAAAMRQDRLCYGYDSVYRRAAEICPHSDVLPLIRHRMFGVAKLYAAAGARQLRKSRRESLTCLRQAYRALALAVGAQQERGDTGRSGERRIPSLVDAPPSRT